MLKRILITATTVVALAWAVPFVNAQPAHNPGIRQPAFRGGFGNPVLRGPMGTFRGFNTPRHFAYRAPYFGPRVAPPSRWGPSRLPRGAYWGPRYWFWITWDPTPWPIYVYYPGPYYYYYYYPYPYTYQYENYGKSTSSYKYGNQYGNPGSPDEYQQPTENEEYYGSRNENPSESSQGYQQENINPKQYQKEYEQWIVSELGLTAKQKHEFLTHLRKLQSLRENFMKKRADFTDELASLQQKGASEKALNQKMTQIEKMDNTFQKEEQVTLSKLMKTLTVGQKAKYYSLQSQFGQEQSQRP